MTPPTRSLPARSQGFVFPGRLYTTASLCLQLLYPVYPSGWNEADFRNHNENPQRKQVATQSDFFPLTLDTALCFTSKNSCAGSVIRICSRWMYYSRDDIFTDLSLYVFPFMCACTSVEPAELTLSGSLTAIEGQELNLSCYTTSSNPPVDIRWWLGYKELNNTSVAMEEVGLHGTQFAQRWNSSTQSYDYVNILVDLNRILKKVMFLYIYIFFFMNR